ncbi:MAG TPA: VWA domain-containing protein [Bryobacteraceae bacterium]|nr:VWA domain-containing protein [Bryobacteraceae bacterium]
MPVPVTRSAVFALTLAAGAWHTAAQEPIPPHYRVDVNLVGLTFSVTDAKGRPVHGLRPDDIRISEDGIPQRIAAFAEGSSVREHAPAEIPQGTNVFILFDTSDRMYRSIPYVCDAIANFLRKLDPADAAAVYTFSRNLSRAAPLTRDRLLVRAGLAQNVSTGDDTALFNCLLLTLRDAARVPGRKAVVVFSNGPDNRSMLSPEDVGTVAEDEGIPVYVISTLDPGKDHLTAAALERLTARTGGKLFLTRNWQVLPQTFTAIHEEISASYTAYYYPAPNPNDGFRRIAVTVASPQGKACTIRTRSGYRAHRIAPPPR